MPLNSVLSSTQVLQLATDFNGFGDAARSILASDTITLTPDQSNIVAADMTQLYNTAANLATWSASITFADSDAAFQSLASSTQAASVKLASLVKTIGTINSAMSILASAVALGVSFGTGNFVSVTTSAANLAQAVSKA